MTDGSRNRWWEFASHADGVYREELQSMPTDRLKHHNAVHGLREEIDFIQSASNILYGSGLGEYALDVGCGSGTVSDELMRRGLKVTGVDLSEAAVELARKRCPGGDFRVLDAARPELLGQERYSFIYFRAFHPFFRIDEFSLQSSIIEGYCSLLRPSGVVAIMNPNVNPSLNIELLRELGEKRGWRVEGPYFPQFAKRVSMPTSRSGLTCGSALSRAYAVFRGGGVGKFLFLSPEPKR